MLGCSDYEVFLMERGARRMVKQLKYTSLEWNRNVDDVSLANIQLAGIQGGKGTFCCDDAHLIIPWQHEVGIYRNGQRVWAGPVVSRAATKSGVAINCRDLMVWMKRRRVHNTHDFINQDLAVMFHDIVKDALLTDNSMGLTVEPHLCGVNGDRRILRAQFKTAWNELDELSRTGVDWTVIDRQVTIGNFELNIEPIGTLTDRSFVELADYTLDGSDLVTDALTIGDGFGEAGATIYGQTIGGDLARYGVHELTYQESTIRDNPSAKRNSRTRWDLNHEPAQLFSGGDLAQECPLEVSDLIPGRAIRLALSESICDNLAGLFRVAGVTGSAGPDHDRVSLRVQPLGTTALVG